MTRKSNEGSGVMGEEHSLQLLGINEVLMDRGALKCISSGKGEGLAGSERGSQPNDDTGDGALSNAKLEKSYAKRKTREQKRSQRTYEAVFLLQWPCLRLSLLLLLSWGSSARWLGTERTCLAGRWGRRDGDEILMGKGELLVENRRWGRSLIVFTLRLLRFEGVLGGTCDDAPPA